MTTLKNPLHGLDYTMVNGYYLPNLTVAAPAEQHPTGRWGRLHKMYLKEHRPIRYNQLLLSGELGSYLAKLDKQAEEQLALIIRQMQAAFEETLEVFDTKDLEQKENQELLARKCMSLAMECIRAHIFVAIDCGEEQMKPAKQTVKERGGNVFRDWRRVTSVALLYIKRNQEQDCRGRPARNGEICHEKGNRRNLCAGAL